MIQFQDVSFSYPTNKEKLIINQVSFEINQGEYLAIVGPNGSGKSTVAKLINGLLLPTAGKVLVAGLDTRSEEDVWKIRQQVGMVFQNPENQMVATTVIDDVAFGLENIGYPPAQMLKRIQDALEKVGMWEHRLQEPQHLSGGQKQRVAIAGILVMKPDMIIFDESTSMLDPQGRAQMRQIMSELHQEGLTVITITHDMEEALDASRVIMLQEGRIALDGDTAAVFEEVKLLQANQLALPFTIEARGLLNKYGLQIPPTIQKKEELVAYLWTSQSKI